MYAHIHVTQGKCAFFKKETVACEHTLLDKTCHIRPIPPARFIIWLCCICVDGELLWAPFDAYTLLKTINLWDIQCSVASIYSFMAGAYNVRLMLQSSSQPGESAALFEYCPLDLHVNLVSNSFWLIVEGATERWHIDGRRTPPPSTEIRWCSCL